MIPSKAACVLLLWFKACVVPEPALAIAAADVGSPPPEKWGGGGFVPVIPAFRFWQSPPGIDAVTHIRVGGAGRGLEPDDSCLFALSG